MTIAAETVSRTYKCDWCNDEVTVTENIEQLPEGWVDPQGDPPIGSHYCGGECKWEANELWSSAWDVGMNAAHDYFERNRVLSVNGDLADYFQHLLSNIRERISFLVSEADQEMYCLTVERKLALRNLLLKTDELYNGLYETAD